MSEEDKTVAQRIEEFFKLKDTIANMDDSIKKHKAELEKMGEELIENMEASGLTQLKDASGRVVFLKTPAVYASIKKEKKEDALALLKGEWQLGDFIQESVSPSTLSRVVKERLETGKTVPDDLFSVFLKKKLGYRK